MSKPVPNIFETAVQACVRLGLKPGDVLMSKFWDGVPLRIDEIREKELWVTRIHFANGKWKDGVSHAMKYLPSDVSKREEAIIAKEGK